MWIVLMFVFMILAAVDLVVLAKFAWTGVRELRSPELPQHDTKQAKQPLNETASLVGGGNVAGPPNRCCAVM